MLCLRILSYIQGEFKKGGIATFWLTYLVYYFFQHVTATSIIENLTTSHID